MTSQSAQPEAVALIDRTTAHAHPAGQVHHASTIQDALKYRRLMALISGPWSARIVEALNSHGSLRFTEIRDSIAGLSAKTLSARLKAFEADGIVHRTDLGGMPPHVVYSITDEGRSLVLLLAIMSQWAAENLDATEPIID